MNLLFLKKKFLYSSLSVIGSALCAYGYAPYNQWFLPILGLILLAYVLAKQGSSKLSALYVFIFALTLNLGSLWWISSVLKNFGEMPFILATLIILLLSSYLALFYALAGFISRSCSFNKFLELTFFFPLFWVCSDFINGYLFTGFPWNWLGYTQISSPVSSIAPIVGAEGITLILLMFAGAIGYLIYKFKVAVLAIPLSIIAFITISQNLTFTTQLPSVKVALLQGNIPTETKWNPEQISPTLKTYFKLIEQNLDSELIILPESAIPALENDTELIIHKLDNLMYENNIGFITGIQYFDEEKNAYYNGMIGIGKIDNQGEKHYVFGKENRYYKRHLVPIGEFVPFESVLRMLGPIFNMPMSSFTRGAEEQPNIEIHGLKVASAICYEIIFNSELINQIKKDTSLIVTLSNDGWFNNTNGPDQHLAIARMRALEFGKPVLRATNNGITAVIDHKGQIIDVAPSNEVVALKTKVKPSIGMTPYTYYGRIPMIILIIIAFILSSCARFLTRKIIKNHIKMHNEIFQKNEKSTNN